MLTYWLGSTSIYLIYLENSSAHLFIIGAYFKTNITSVLIENRDDSIPY